MVYGIRLLSFALMGVGLLIIAVLPVYGQRKAKVDTVAAFRAHMQGERFKIAAKFDSAITFYQQAAAGYKAYALSLPKKEKWVVYRKKAWEQHFIARASIGWCLEENGKLDTALKVLLKARAACSQELGDSSLAMASIVHTIGVVYRNQGQYAQSLENYKHSLAIRKQVLGEQHTGLAKSYGNIGNVYMIQGLYVQALEYHQQTLAIFKRAHGEQHPNVANSYNSLGYVYLIQGQYAIALEYFQQALAIFKQALGEQHPKVANSYNNIGNVYADQGQYAQALKYQLQAMAITKQVMGERHPDVAISYGNIGIVYADQGQYAQALECFQQALSIFRQTFGEQQPEVASTYNNIGNVYAGQGQYTQALELYLQSLAIHKQTFGEKHPEVAMSYSNIGQMYAHLSQFTAAIEQYQHSLRAYLPNFDSNRYRSLSANSPDVLKSPLLYQPIALRLRNKPGDDTLALTTIRFADRFIDSLRKAYSYENDKLELGTSANKLYQVGIDVAIWNKQEEEAFYFSEKNKAAVLAQSLNEATALKLGGIPDSLVNKDKELRALVTFYSKSITDEELKCPNCDSTKLQNLQNGLFRYQQEHSALKDRLESEFPQYFALKYKDAKMSVKQIRQGFLSENPNSAILEYLLGDSVLYAFCITKDKYAFHRQKLDTTRFKNANALQLEIKKLGRALADAKLYLDSTATVSQPASILYDYLIKPFEQQIKGKDLVIIPDGELNKIPFELLMKPHPNLIAINKWQNLPYLMKQHNISYHYSAQLLLEEWQKSKTQPVQSSGLMAFAPLFESNSTLVNRDALLASAQLAKRQEVKPQFKAFLSNQSNYQPLPGTEREVKAIYELFSQQNQPAKYYLNDQANESTVKSLDLKPYKYLHFATHGLTDEDRPTQSCLILAQNQYPLPSPNGEGSFDNLLTSSEMYGLELDAELVVLSACQTGKGKLKAGEGIIGLTRGLLYAGARNLLVSQWNVNDASTAELMTKFYAKILAGQSNRQALREAKLELLNSKFACPHYWSAFVLVGR
jgi:CHAT domain-containing protein/Tfp pilus assembly protein PilF